MKRLPQVEQKLRESGHPGQEPENHPPSGHVGSSGELAAQISHDVNNPLAVLIANLDFLQEVVSQMRVESKPDLGSLAIPEAGESFAARLCEADIALRDAQDAAERIRVIVRGMKQQIGKFEHPVAGTVSFGNTSLTSADGELTSQLTAEDRVIRPARILVVDDEESVARVLQRIFRQYDVVTLVSPQEALDRLLKGERFDAILCDVTMAKISGCDFYEELVRFAPEQAERLVFLTGGSTTERVRLFLATVVQPVLEKPFTPKELRAFIEKFLG